MITQSYFRDRAARIIQKFFISNRWVAIPAPILEPYELDALFISQLSLCSKEGKYHEVDYAHPEFVRSLFAACRLDKIAKNDLMMFKFIHDLLLAFNYDLAPQENTLALLSQHFPVNDNDYCLIVQAIGMWDEEKQHILRKAIAQNTSNKLFFYCIGLPDHLAIMLIRLFLGSDKQLSNLSEIATLFVYQFAQAKQKPYFLNLLRNLSDITEEQRLELFEFFYQLERSQSHRYSAVEEGTNEQDMLFLAAIIKVYSRFPCLSPSSNNGLPGKPLLNYILPTIELEALIQSILYDENAIEAFPILGRLTCKLIRAMYDVPVARSQNIRSPALEKLARLYPMTVQLNGPARPIELTYPNVKRLIAPHGYYCRDFWLERHDCFHVWRSSSNPKLLLFYLRNLLDNVYGFSLKNSGMSKALWALTDMDYSFGMAIRSQHSDDEIEPFTAYVFTGLLTVLKSMGCDFSCSKEINALLLFDMIKNHGHWWRLLEAVPERDFITIFNPSIAMLLTTLSEHDRLRFTLIWKYFAKEEDPKFFQRFYYKLLEILDGQNNHLHADMMHFLNQYKNMLWQVKHNPNACITEILIREHLQPLFLDETLLIEFHKIGYEKIFYWSVTKGVCFRQAVLKQIQDLRLSCDLIVQKNSALQLLNALKAVVKIGNAVNAPFYRVARDQTTLFYDAQKHVSLNHLSEVTETSCVCVIQ